MRNLYLLICIVLTGCGAFPVEPAGMSNFDGERAFNRVRSQLDLGFRIPGTDAHRRTADWIVEQLTQEGWETEEQIFTYRGVEIRNIIGTRDNPNMGNPIIIGAHYDTRPRSEKDPNDPSQPVPGANDGASGVAVLLELARVIPSDERKHPLWLVFFDAEDSGKIDGWEWIVGSTYFVENLTIEPEAVVIVDMVGDAQLELYYERNSDSELASQIWGVAASLGYDSFIPAFKYSILDDHTPFLTHGYPAIDIIDFDYPYWHTADDTLDKISAESLEQVGRTLQTWLASYP